jgi:prepilin-type N-terminal cleavage/methylation domain-containing protein|nr:prepilin-type N-terminal cleavage/methylation domain-containing protein [Candidatus Krumholzibacteria bacterium]
MSFKKVFLARLSRVLPDREGFSLVEILMVLMILTVGIIPLAVIQHQARQDVQESDMYTSSLNVAQSQLERIKGLGFGNAVPDSGQVGNIQWRARVTNVSFGLDRVEVTTTWTGGGANQTITVADLMSMR